MVKEVGQRGPRRELSTESPSHKQRAKDPDPEKRQQPREKRNRNASSSGESHAMNSPREGAARGRRSAEACKIPVRKFCSSEQPL